MDTKRLTGILLLVLLTVLGVWVAIPQHPSLKIGAFERDLDLKLGLDLRGGAQLVYQADLSGIDQSEAEDALAGVRDVIERRVNSFGISEPIIQTNRVGDEYRLIVELAGIFDTATAIEKIKGTPQLDFRREVVIDEAVQQYNIDDPDAITGIIWERTDLTGKHLKRATVGFDQLSGAPQVNLIFNSEGSKIFADLTRNNIGKRLGVFRDGVVEFAPVVQNEITSGEAVLTGGYTIEEARKVAQTFNSGALPIPINLISQQTVGPTLGTRSLQQSLEAGSYGLLAVMIWMIFYYRLPGVIASISLIIYVIFFLGLVKLIPVTLTLAGVAGLILSIGMAVDSNVLIFERFRENIRRGKNVGYALEGGFRDAWGSIVASNVSSLITAVILFSLGSSIVRGFALTFSLGIILSMFSAISITRLLLSTVLLWEKTHHPLLLGARKVAK